jgi:hypothetical protein|tara:strand:+ start:108 stop:308 length:201 start_codon:yes stop_codon:yes gene_type:complete
MKLKLLDEFIDLWNDNKLKKLWNNLSKLNQEDFAFIVAWMTVMIRDESEIRLSQWLVWLETKSESE